MSFSFDEFDNVEETVGVSKLLPTPDQVILSQGFQEFGILFLLLVVPD
jgi:hypothetical protein